MKYLWNRLIAPGLEWPKTLLTLFGMHHKSESRGNVLICLQAEHRILRSPPFSGGFLPELSYAGSFLTVGCR